MALHQLPAAEVAPPLIIGGGAFKVGKEQGHLAAELPLNQFIELASLAQQLFDIRCVRIREIGNRWRCRTF
ncbi:MAG: hypothetical protein HYZ81_15940 [Nitrospinae bacterium]|nr:hypothetical protein [Nitrospinota bacterium]